MVSGMTTVKVGFVSAVLEVGYHVELADGGHYSPAVLRAKVAESKGRLRLSYMVHPFPLISPTLESHS
jgi:fatty acid synthase subunit alpha